MAANILDKFTEATNGTRPDNAALTAQKSIGAASITVDSTAGWGTATAVHFVIYQIDAGGARVANTQTEWKGIVSSSTSITSLTLKAGTDQVYPVGSKVIATPTAAAWDDLVEGVLEFANQDGSLITQAVRDALGLTSGETSGWETLGYAPNTITALGNRSYTVVVNSVDLTATTSVGMRLKLPRTVTAPTQCTSLNGTTQYYSRTSAGLGAMTFTDDFTVSAWVKLSSYPTSNAAIASRYNGTSGWALRVDTSGQILMIGNNAGSTNYRFVNSYQSIPLNKWVHITAFLDMSGNTYTSDSGATNNYIMIDGVVVPGVMGAGGTSPTTLVQAGDLNIGTANSGTGYGFIPGKIAQVAIYSARVTPTVIRASMNQTLTGSETSLICAYTFNNAVTDLSSNGYTLTAQASAVATNADTPFTNPVTGTSVTAGTTNYGIIMAQTFSTNTTYTIQIPEGETLPTTGGIGTVSYSTQKTPYGFPGQKDKWNIEAILNGYRTTAFTGGAWGTATGPITFSIPIGTWDFGYRGPVERQDTVANQCDLRIGMSTSAPNPSDYNLVSGITNTAANTYTGGVISVRTSATFSTATVYTLINYIETGTSVSGWFPSAANKGYFRFYAENGLL